AQEQTALSAPPARPSLTSVGANWKPHSREAAEQKSLPSGADLIMTFKLSVLLLVLAVVTVLVTAQRRRPTSKTNDEWNYRDGG
ncbi:hypothetical protein GOODEAATRI_029894, partial [Goodea atripinnis]